MREVHKGTEKLHIKIAKKQKKKKYIGIYLHI